MAGASLAPGEAGSTPNQRKRKAPPAPAAAAADEAEAAEREPANLDRRALEHIRGTATAPSEAGASPNQRKRKAPSPAAAAEAEAEELERELADLDRRTLEHIRGTATRLVTAAVSHLAALRPPAPLEVSLASATFADDQDQKQLEKLKILKSKMEANVADLPMVLEKMKDSISRWERLGNLNVNIHPVFQGKT